MLGDLRGIFILGRICAIGGKISRSLIGAYACLVENCSEANSHFGAVGRTHGMRPSGRGGRRQIWGVMRRAGSCGGGLGESTILMGLRG